MCQIHRHNGKGITDVVLVWGNVLHAGCVELDPRRTIDFLPLHVVVVVICWQVVGAIANVAAPLGAWQTV